MTDRQTLCTTLGLDPASAAAVLDAPGPEDIPRGAAGWLAEAVLALAGWITAVVLVLLAAAFLHQVFGIKDPSWAHPALGAGLFGTGMALLHRRDGTYGTQVAVALAAAGAALFAGGVAAIYRETLSGPHITHIGPTLRMAALAALLPAAAVIAARAPRVLQFLTSAGVIALATLAVVEARLPHGLALLAPATLAGAALLLFPPRRDLRPTAALLLLVVPLADVHVLPWLFGPGPGAEPAWIARALLAAPAAALAWRWARLSEEGFLPLAAAAVAAAVALTLPPGGGAALVILLLAGLLGSPALAGLGAVVEAGFLWRFYADLRLDLLEKAGLLVAVGVVLLAAWAWLERRGREDRA